MKKTALLLLLILCISSPAFAQTFVKVAESDTSIIYVDRSSIQARDGYVVATTKWVPKGSLIEHLKEVFNEEISYYLDFCAYHVKYRQIQSLSLTYYDRAGNSVRTDMYAFDPNNYMETPPGSVGETIYDFVAGTYHTKIQLKPSNED